MPAKMHSDRRPNHLSFRLKTLTAVVLTTLAVCNAHAAGLGKLTVLSALGQPLHAEIDLTSVSPEEVATLAPKLASAEAFKQANIDFHPALLGLRFAIEQRAGRYFIRVTSSQPMNEPFVDMMLELGAANGRLVREYTFLLDPAELRTAQSPQVAAPAILPPAATARREVASAVQQQSIPTPAAAAPVAAAAATPAATAPARSPAAAPAPAAVIQYRPSTTTAATPASAATQGKQLDIRRGDTLAKVARENLPAGVSLDQMLVALYRANPDAFVGANMNRLRAGQILTVPQAEVISATPPAQARTEVLAQSADFNEYRNKLAGQVAGADARKPEGSSQSASGKISAKVAEPASAASEAKDKLRLSRARDADQKSASARDSEERIASEKALAESNARVRELERNVGDLQKLLEIKNRSLAERQKTAEAEKNNAAPAVAAVIKPTDTVVAKAAESAAAKPVPALPAAASTPPINTAAPDAPIVKAPPKPALVSRPAPPPESLLDHPLVLPGAGILLAVLAALGLLAARRKRQSAIDRENAREPGLKTNSMFGLTGGQSVDTNNSEFNSSFAPTTGHLTGSEVDPIAEADVYIAYGRDAQAEEILKEALRANPDRHAVRVRLLEIYANRKDMVSFEPLAAELLRMTGGKGEEWEQAAALTRSFDPNAPAGSGRTRHTKFASRSAPANDDLDDRPGTRHVEPLSDKTVAHGLPPMPVLAAATAAAAAAAAAPVIARAAPVIEPLPTPQDDRTQIVAPVEPAPAKSLESLDFDLQRLSAKTEPGVKPPDEPVPLASNMEEITFDFLDGPDSASKHGNDLIADLPEHGTPAPTPNAPVALEDEFALMEADFAKFEVPGKDRARPIDPMPAPADFDLSDISLELSPQESAPAASGISDGVFELDDLAFEEPTQTIPSGAGNAASAEMSTKLDLAIAYEEIGDKEGARELLEEVITGGSTEQIQKAQALLKNLS